MVNKTTKKSLTSEEEQELEQLEARLAELKKRKTSVQEEEPEQDLSKVKIEQDEYIPVMSLINNTLNLSTKGFGTGNVKKFTRFGEIKRILYKDLLDIIESHSNFMETGKFYILHPAFVRQNGLDEIYSKILNKEKIDQILALKTEECVEIFKSANESQQKTIVEMLIQKVRDNPDSVNLNMLDRISRLSKIDIQKVAEEASELMAEKKETEQ